MNSEEEKDSLVLLGSSMTLESANLPLTDSSSASSDDDDDSINGEDLTPSGRYFLGPDSGPKCFNCGKGGHVSRECPETQSLPCFLCGGVDHQRSNCPEEVCYNCQMIGHHSRDCTKPRRRRIFPGSRETCNRCQLPGHLFKDCSLSWRRYVFTTPNPPTRNDLIRADKIIHPSCYECGEFNTHWGDECSHRRRAEYSIFHTPNQHFLSLAHLSDVDISNDNGSGRYSNDNNQQQQENQQHHRPRPNNKSKKNIFDHQLPSSTSKTSKYISAKKTPPNRHYKNSNSSTASRSTSKKLPTAEEQYLRAHTLPNPTKKKN